jgi:DNA replication licensing factor MCM3
VCESSDTKTKLLESSQFCHATQKYHTTKHQNFTSLNIEAPSSYGGYPAHDQDGNVLELDYAESVYMDYQTIIVRDLPQYSSSAPSVGRVEVILTHDLVNKCTVGDHVQIFGDYRELPHTWDPNTGIIGTAIVANNVILDQSLLVDVSEEDKVECKKLSLRTDILDLLARSLAPSVYGHDTIKRALICLLVAGVEKRLLGGIHLRGDINILLVGDPSCGKSQLLRCVLTVAERGILTSGRGSSGVGLTACVVTDPVTKGRCLQAGAMVLGDRGVVCIDEFDKMADIDRATLHQTMEQQQFTICKAHIIVTLNTRCSVLAAANPIDGRYDPLKTPVENIAIQDSLVSRFDLVFIVHDKIDPELDRIIAEHITQRHCFR